MRNGKGETGKSDSPQNRERVRRNIRRMNALVRGVFVFMGSAGLFVFSILFFLADGWITAAVFVAFLLCPLELVFSGFLNRRRAFLEWGQSSARRA